MDSLTSDPVFEDRYEMVWFNTPILDHTGSVYNYTIDGEGKREIRIKNVVWDRAGPSFRFVAHAWATDVPFIAITQDFYQLPKSSRDGSIWHEVGHIHYEHFLNANFKSQEEIREYRINFTKKGQIWPAELEADIFAAKRIGKQAYIESLKYLKDSRPRGDNGSLNEIGRKELILRIRAINEMKF